MRDVVRGQGRSRGLVLLLGALAISALVAGCSLLRSLGPVSTPRLVYISPEPACTNPPMRSGVAAQLVQDGAVVVYERNGGLSCRDELYAVYPDGRVVSAADGSEQARQVEPSAVSQLLAGIDDAGFFSDEFFTTYHPPCSACHQYSVTATYGGQTKTVGYVDGGTTGPAKYWIVITLLNEFVGISD